MDEIEEILIGSDIEVITEDDPDYKYILAGRKERKEHPEDYVSIDEVIKEYE